MKHNPIIRMAEKAAGVARSALDMSFKFAATGAALVFLARAAPEGSNLKSGTGSLVNGADSVAGSIVNAARKAVAVTTERKPLDIFE